MKTWYILMDGTSEDGRGSPSFYKRTVDKEEAIEFLLQKEKEWYSIAEVWYVTDSEMEKIFPWSDVDSL